MTSCPGIDLVLSYYSDLLEEAQRQSAIEHFSDCEFCQTALIEHSPKTRGIILRFICPEDIRCLQLRPAKAAGISQFPESISIGQIDFCDVILSIHNSPMDNALEITPKTTAKIRSQLMMRLHYSDASFEDFAGSSIASFGYWRIASEKIAQIQHIDITYQP